MKLKLSRKQVGIIVLLIIIVPIAYNKLSGVITGFLQQQAMNKCISRKEVAENIILTYS